MCHFQFALPPASVTFFAAVIAAFGAVFLSERKLRADVRGGRLAWSGQLSVLLSSTADELMTAMKESRRQEQGDAGKLYAPLNHRRDDNVHGSWQ